MASLKSLRRRGARYEQEQAAIERWLGAVVDGAAVDWELGFELAQCGRLIKGYGATNERGKRNLVHILEHLARGAVFASSGERAAAIRVARDAALADERGTALDQALAHYGAPTRPVVPAPIVWQRAPKQRAAETTHGD